MIQNDQVSRLKWWATCFSVCVFALTAHFLDAFSHLYKRVCPSIRWSVHPSVRPLVRRSVGHTRVEFLRNEPNLNKIASGIRKYAIQRAIQKQLRGQFALTHLLSDLAFLLLITVCHLNFFSQNSNRNILVTMPIQRRF